MFDWRRRRFDGHIWLMSIFINSEKKNPMRYAWKIIKIPFENTSLKNEQIAYNIWTKEKLLLVIYKTKTNCVKQLNRLSIFHWNFVKIDAPSCSPNQPRIYGVAKQEQAQIRCSVDANPPDVEFKWTFNNSAESIDVASNHVTRSGKWHNALFPFVCICFQPFKQWKFLSGIFQYFAGWLGRYSLLDIHIFHSIFVNFRVCQLP